MEVLDKKESAILGICFAYEGEFFYYDTNKNTILKITPEQYRAIKQLLNTNKCVAESQAEMILHLKKKGYLSSLQFQSIEFPSIEEVFACCSNNVSHMVLQVTKNCNFMCRYCLYAGPGFFDRSHSDEKMSTDIAKKAVDFLFMHSKNSTDVRISFYGGEPLLNFQLIKECIVYCKQLFQVKHCSFDITTNGSLLYEEICEFLVKENVTIYVSLDGPEFVQNRNRKFLKTGGNTFDCVEKNLLRLKITHPDYFREHVYIQPVITPSTAIQDVNLYFTNVLGVSTQNIKPNPINLDGLDLLFDRNRQENVNASFLKEIEKKFDDQFQEIYNNKNLLPNIFHPPGQCYPGVQKLFVNTSGEFYPCEKIVESNIGTCIGSIFAGFNYNSIKEMMNLAKITQEKCKQCWAIRYCHICICDIDSESTELMKDTRETLCIQKKAQTLEFFKRKINIMSCTKHKGAF